MEPLATCVVDNAMPRWLEQRMITAEEVSAAMPCGELISTSPLPMVRITRHPPTQVPAAMVRAQAIFTHTGSHAGCSNCRKRPVRG
jgi:hypothetical protein